jgi:hypothetical protein
MNPWFGLVLAFTRRSTYAFPLADAGGRFLSVQPLFALSIKQMIRFPRIIYNCKKGAQHRALSFRPNRLLLAFGYVVYTLKYRLFYYQ